MNNARILSSEYAAFRREALEYFEDELKKQKPLILLDPMSGTAPLIPSVELGGHKAYFNDILPLHYFINQAKTYRNFRYYEQSGVDWFLNELLKHMNSLKNKRLLISEKWLDDSILDGLLHAWHAVGGYDDNAKNIMRAAILLCVRPFSSVTKSTNPTWLKFGGISSSKGLQDIIEESLSRIENYYKKHYQSSRLENIGECIFLNNRATEINLTEKVDLIITSPPYCNRFDILRSYGPENYFISKIGYEVQAKDIIGTIQVKDYSSVDSDYDYLTKNSDYANILLSEMKHSKKKDEQSYYLKYYTRYFIMLLNSIESTIEHLSVNGKMYLVTQDNIHRGQLIEIEKVIAESLGNKGWKAELINKWERHHMGLQNVSKDKAFIKKRQFEKLTVIKR